MTFCERCNGPIYDKVGAAAPLHVCLPMPSDMDRLRAENAQLRDQLGCADVDARVRHAETIVVLRSRELLAAQTELDEWRDVTGLACPAEERGGDPGGVKPKHLKKLLADLEARIVRTENEVTRVMTEMDRRDAAAARLRAELEQMKSELATNCALLLDAGATLASARSEIDRAEEAVRQLVEERDRAVDRCSRMTQRLIREGLEP